MPAKPTTISLSDLDPAIRDAVARIAATGKIKPIKGPIINGIIASEAILKGVKPLAVAKEITAGIPGAEALGLKPAATVIAPGKILVGFQMRAL